MTQLNYDWLPADLQGQVQTILAGPMPRGRNALRYRVPLSRMDDRSIDGRQHIVFVSYYPAAGAIKKSIALRKTGRYYTTFIGCCIREDVEIEHWFDQYYEIDNYTELVDIMTHAAPQAISVLIQPVILAALVCAAMPNTRIVIDVNDPALYTHTDPNHALCRLERACIQAADAVLHKMHPDGIAHMRTVWQTDIPAFEAQCLPNSDFNALSCAHLTEKPWLVYAGGVMPPAIARNCGHANQVLDTLISQTAHAPMRLTVLANQYPRDMHWEEYRQYRELMHAHTHFEFRAGVPLHRLPRTIAAADFGLLYDDIESSRVHEHDFRFNMSTKVFSYLEAGLPILCYRDFDYLAQLIEAHGIGILYARSELDRLPDIMRNSDYQTLAHNVTQFRDNHELMTIVPQLAAAYLDKATS